MNTTLEFHQQGRAAAFLDDVGEGAIADLLREGGAVLRPGVEGSPEAHITTEAKHAPASTLAITAVCGNTSPPPVM